MKKITLKVLFLFLASLASETAQAANANWWDNEPTELRGAELRNFIAKKEAWQKTVEVYDPVSARWVQPNKTFIHENQQRFFDCNGANCEGTWQYNLTGDA